MSDPSVTVPVVRSNTLVRHLAVIGVLKVVGLALLWWICFHDQSPDAPSTTSSSQSLHHS